MSFIENLFYKYNCIFCKYKKYKTKDNQYECMYIEGKDEYGYPIGKCHSLSNFYYGTLINYFPFQQIDDIRTIINAKKEERYLDKMDKKYGDCSLETDEYKFIWGIKSWDDLSGADACMYTMNDIELGYDKHEKKYYLSIETAYIFKNYKAECKYLQACLNAFTKYMDSNNLDTNKKPILFMSNLGAEMCASTIEELYANFKILVNGYCCSFDE